MFDKLLWPFSMANCAGVFPSVSRAFINSSPPHKANTCAASAFPRIADQCSAVHPSLSALITSASNAKSNFTTSLNPLYAPQCNGLRLSSSMQFTSKFHLNRKWYSIDACPYCAATCAAVYPRISLLCSVACRCNKSSATGNAPRTAAQWSAVCFSPSPAFTSAPRSSKRFAIATRLFSAAH